MKWPHDPTAPLEIAFDIFQSSTTKDPDLPAVGTLLRIDGFPEPTSPKGVCRLTGIDFERRVVLTAPTDEARP